jgi:hypothetical protein
MSNNTTCDCCDPYAAARDFNNRYGAPLHDDSYGTLPHTTEGAVDAG